MAIAGLGADNYCAHTPIPISVTPIDIIQWFDPVMRMQVTSDAELLNPMPVFYQTNGFFLLDLAPWVRMGMKALRDNVTYSTTLITAPDLYRSLMTIRVEFKERTGTIWTNPEIITKTFVHCALDSWRLIDEVQNIKVWKGYPVSWTTPEDRRQIIPTTNTPPAIPNANIEYIQDGCNGTYIKWLNKYGEFSYWLFPHSRELENEATEYYRTPRDIFDNAYNGRGTSNEDTVGFEAKANVTVRDIILSKYWDVIESIVDSPEVYMLRTDYVPGTGPIPVTDWIKIIQNGFTFNRVELSRSATEVAITFDLPKPYSITRL